MFVLNVEMFIFVYTSLIVNKQASVIEKIGLLTDVFWNEHLRHLMLISENKDS